MRILRPVFATFLALMVIACVSNQYRTIDYRYPDGQVCRQFYDFDSETFNCSCQREFSNNYTKYSPNYFRSPRPRYPGVDGYCLTPEEYAKLR